MKPLKLADLALISPERRRIAKIFKTNIERAIADQLMDILMRDDEVRCLLCRKVRELYSSPQHHPSLQAEL